MKTDTNIARNLGKRLDFDAKGRDSVINIFYFVDENYKFSTCCDQGYW